MEPYSHKNGIGTYLLSRPELAVAQRLEQLTKKSLGRYVGHDGDDYQRAREDIYTLCEELFKELPMRKPLHLALETKHHDSPFFNGLGTGGYCTIPVSGLRLASKSNFYPELIFSRDQDVLRASIYIPNFRGEVLDDLASILAQREGIHPIEQLEVVSSRNQSYHGIGDVHRIASIQDAYRRAHETLETLSISSSHIPSYSQSSMAKRRLAITTPEFAPELTHGDLRRLRIHAIKCDNPLVRMQSYEFYCDLVENIANNMD